MISYKLGTYGFLDLDNLENTALKLLDFGIEKRQGEVYDFDNKKRIYNGYLFQYTFSGCGIFETGEKKHYLTPGKAFFVSIPDDSRYYLPLQGESVGEEWQYFYLHFEGDAAVAFFSKITQLFGKVFEIPVESNPVRMFLSLYEKVTKEQTLRKYEGGEFLYSFLSNLLRELESPALENRSDYVRHAVEKMDTDYDKLIGIEDIANWLNISFSHLTRLFQKEMGISPIHYLTNVRLQNAMFLLLNDKTSVEQIAVQCGFSCGNYFCKVFRKTMKMSPLEYRKRNQS